MIGTGLQKRSLNSDKADRSRYSIGNREIRVRGGEGTPLLSGWTKEFRFRQEWKATPVRHEKLAAIGKKVTQIRLHKKR